MGFEHSVVHMFLSQIRLMVGGMRDYLIWNEIPTMLGNPVCGLTFVGLMVYGTHARTAPSQQFEAKVKV